jgi:hypothetical protein
VRVLKLRNRFKYIFLTILIASLLLSSQAFAADDTEDSLTLEIDYRVNSTSLVGAQFDLYLVAIRDENDDILPVEDFMTYNDDIKAAIDSGVETIDQKFMELTTLLEGYVKSQGDVIKPTDSGTTNASGILLFPTGDKALVDGLYLIIGHTLTQGGYIYEATPFMTFLPRYDGSMVDYYLRAIPKVDYREVPPPDNPSPDNPPPDNPPDEPTPDEPTPQSDDTPVPTLDGSVEDTPDISLQSDDTPLPTLEGSLPQTGQLWWPIPFLVAGGLILIIIGIVRRRSEYED